MIWKEKLYVDDAQTAKSFKKDILKISPEIVVSVTKSENQYLVQSSVERVGGGLDEKIRVTKELSNLYKKYNDDKFGDDFKVVEGNKSKSTLRTLVEKIVKDELKKR